MGKKETPTAVRVARWTAAAAAITAFGTICNTFIEKRPWFLGGEPEKPTKMVSAMMPESMNSAVTMSAAPDMGIWTGFLNFMKYSPVSFWTIFGSLSLLAIYLVFEFLHHRRNKQ